MSWKKERPYTGVIYRGCTCSSVSEIAELEWIVGVGYGDACITRDDIVVYQETNDEDRYLKEFEEMARKDPNHDWRMTLMSALHGEVYQRQGDEKWVLIESNQGFA